ncbi:aminopeptidase [Xylophilus sp. Kf1]|nr:aminopeptidase [Xylophilus sp. Kf1]
MFVPVPAFRARSFVARFARLARAVPALVALATLAGCAGSGGAGSGVGYYWQSISGHLQLMRSARPVDDWLNDAGTSEVLKDRLRLSQRIRAFASRELGLPDNPSYRRYADLHRTAAVWNVVAAPPLSLKLQTWCFPITGCIGYRGYYREATAREEAAALQGQGLEAAVYGVPAYSTLGWLNWAGGDPLLSTFIGYPEGELARMVFHELAHQVVYAQDDTTFNESFATAVEQLGRDRWLATEASPEARTAYTRFAGRQRDFRELTRDTRRSLEDVYRADDAPAAEKTEQKQRVMADFRARYAVLRLRWGGDAAGVAGYDRWVADANNASFGALAAYDTLVPAFEALFARTAAGAPTPRQAWPLFYAEVRRLAGLPAPDRLAALQALAPP